MSEPNRIRRSQNAQSSHERAPFNFNAFLSAVLRLPQKHG
jgi:hypothetical protein